MAKQAGSVGTQQAWLGIAGGGLYNYLLGSSATAPAAGTISPMKQITGIQAAPTGIPEGEVIPVPGDDGVLGSIGFDSDAPTEFIITTGLFDLDLQALIQGTKVEAVGDINFGVVRPTAAEALNATIIVQSKAFKYDVGLRGQKAWHGYIYPAVNLRFLGRETFEGRTAAVNRFQVTANQGTHKFWGDTFTDQVNGSDSMTAQEFISDNPLVAERITGDGSVVTFNLLNTPITAAKTNVWINGVKQVATTDYTVSAANKTITFGVAPANDAVVVLLYEYAIGGGA